MDFASVDHALHTAVEQGVFPGAVVLVRQAETLLYRTAVGYRSLEPERTPLRVETIFDLASLTKPLATTIAIMLMVKEKKLRLEDRVSRFFSNFAMQGKSHITFRHLLSHTSGLPAWRPYYQEIVNREVREGKVGLTSTRSAREFVYTQLQREKLETPTGRQAVYSDLGFMILGATIEDMSGVGLDQYCQEKIFRPLRVPSIAFINLELIRRHKLRLRLDHYAPTEHCPWRKRILCAEVHDDNTYAMGGVAGHAGLFASIDAIDRLITVLLACYRGEHPFLPAEIVREFWTRQEGIPNSTWCLGWDTPSPQGSSAGQFFSAHSVGHLGFTGTSIWIDLDKQLYVIVLSNRVHPRRENDKIHAFRPILHDTIMRVVLSRQ